MHDLNGLNLIELMKAVQSTYMRSIRAGLTAETRCISTMLDRKLFFLKDYVTIQVGYRNFRRRDQIEVVVSDVVHLPLFVRQLACCESRRLIYHYRHLHFGIARLCGLI